MKFNILTHSRENDIEEIICLLNMPAREFYGDVHTFEDKSFQNSFKGILLSGFIDLERTLKGTFGCDLHLDSIDGKTFKKMFPNACYKLFIKDSNYYRKNLGFILDKLRNINAHAIISEKDYVLFEKDFSFLKNERVFNKQISYYTNEITLAGVIFLLFNFLRAESIAQLTRRENILSIISCGKYGKDDGTKFVEVISHVNLEIDIRQNIGTNFEQSIIGEYSSLIEKDNNSFNYIVGDDLHPTYKVSGKIEDDSITIYEGSLTKAYYDKEYKLIIEDMDGFINFSNKLPPFVLIDYLHECGITTFNKDVELTMIKNWGLISKLNKPKFYVDKNIKILLLPETVSDFRFISGMILDYLNQVFLNIEKYMYEYTKLNTEGYFSTILDVFKTIDESTNKHIAFKINLLRNMAAHGHILDDFLIVYYGVQRFSIKFIATTLYDMLKMLKENVNNDSNSKAKELLDNVSTIIKEQFLDVLIKGKYKQSSKEAMAFLKYYPNYSDFGMQQLYHKNLFIERSILDITEFDCLIETEYEQQRPIYIDIEGFDSPFYLLNREDTNELIENFCKRAGYVVESIKRNPIIINYKLKKK